ncbi:alpha-ketoglutarate-dependent dioxygenase AlkB family protein [Endozoicomonadaceae bacterium StTr2]
MKNEICTCTDLSNQCEKCEEKVFLVHKALPNISYTHLSQVINWQQETIRMFGKTHFVPRLTAYYGELPYRYSGVEHPARIFPEPLNNIRAQVEQLSGFNFNAVLCNFYRNGNDRMGYHRDNESMIDQACIASVSAGAARTFRLRHRKTRQVTNIELEDNSLLLMLNCQEQWEHTLPASRKVTEGRINLTFRRVLAEK